MTNMESVMDKNMILMLIWTCDFLGAKLSTLIGFDNQVWEIS